MPLKELRINDCDKIKDLTPLADCKELERLVLPAHCKGKQPTARCHMQLARHLHRIEVFFSMAHRSTSLSRR